MVAKGVKRATASTRTCREWEVQTETTEEENPEKVGWVFKLCGVRYGGEGSACKGASLGLKQGLTGWRDRCLEFIVHSSVDGDVHSAQLGLGAPVLRRRLLGIAGEG